MGLDEPTAQRSRHIELLDLVTPMALGAVDTQEIWDLQSTVSAATPPLGSPSLRLGSWEFRVAISVVTSREVGFEVSVLPVNLGFAITHKRTYSNASAINLRVERVPARRALDKS